MIPADRPSTLLVELAVDPADPIGTVRRVLDSAGVPATDVWPSFQNPSPRSRRFVKVQLAPDDADRGLRVLQGSTEVASVTPDPDAEP